MNRLVEGTQWAIIAWIVIGIIAGLLAGQAVGGSGFGIIGDMIVGLIGRVIGGWIMSTVTGYSRGFNHGGFGWSLIVAFIGAVVLLLIARLVSGGTRHASVQKTLRVRARRRPTGSVLGRCALARG